MNKVQKIELIQSVLDELATTGYLSDYRCKRSTINLIKDELQSFVLPVKPNVADLYINNAKILVSSPTHNLTNVLQAISRNLELALSEWKITEFDPSIPIQSDPFNPLKLPLVKIAYLK